MTVYQPPIAADWPMLSTVTAAGLNAGMRDPAKFFRSRPQALVSRAAGATIISTGAYSRVIWDTGIHDTNTQWIVGTPSYLWVQCPGHYLVYGKYSFGNYGTGYRAMQLRKNSGTNPAGGSGLDTDLVPFVPSTNTVIRAVASTYMLSQDTVEMFVYQTSGLTQNVVIGMPNMYLGLLWLSA